MTTAHADTHRASRSSARNRYPSSKANATAASLQRTMPAQSRGRGWPCSAPFSINNDAAFLRVSSNSSPSPNISSSRIPRAHLRRGCMKLDRARPASRTPVTLKTYLRGRGCAHRDDRWRHLPRPPRRGMRPPSSTPSRLRPPHLRPRPAPPPHRNRRPTWSTTAFACSSLDQTSAVDQIEATEQQLFDARPRPGSDRECGFRPLSAALGGGHRDTPQAAFKRDGQTLRHRHRVSPTSI